MPETADLADYEWPTCTACGKDLWADETERWACRPCEERTAGRLAELPGLFHQLNATAALMKGSRRIGAGGSGSRTAPIPPRLEVLALVGPGGVAGRLQAIEDSWRIAFGRDPEYRTDGIRMFAPWRSDPARAVPEHVNFLRINLQRACEGYESIGQDIGDLRKLHAECKAIVDDKPRNGRVKIGLCPVLLDGARCWSQLTATVRSFKTSCPSCGTAWEGKEEWEALREAQDRALAEAATVAA